MSGPVIAMPNHWHVNDHYTGARRFYRERGPAMRAWIRRHGGAPIVEVLFCDEPCLDEAEDEG